MLQCQIHATETVSGCGKALRLGLLTPSNRRVRTRTHGGVGGAEPRGSPLSRFRCGPPGDSRDRPCGKPLRASQKAGPRSTETIAAPGSRSVVAENHRSRLSAEGETQKRACIFGGVHTRPQAQRIGHPPRNPALRRQALEVADQQHPEIPPGTQTRSPHPRRVELRAKPLDEGVEASLFKDLVQTLVEGMPSVRRQIRRRHPQRRPLSRRRSLAHRHAVQCTRPDRAAARPDPRLSPQADSRPSGHCGTVQ